MELRRDEDDRMMRLYKASSEGCVATLNSLMEEDPLTLSKLSVNPFGETPLHISAMLGHLNFTKQLLSHNPKGPKLAEELDFHKRSPLHLASAEGHTETVQALIEANKGMCFVRDEDGKIPLHYAAMRGRLQVIQLLIGAEPNSILENLNEGETILHLCVQFNQLEALQMLVGSVKENSEFLNSKDQKCGNTILHLAVMLKQIETIKYLLSIPEVKAGAADMVNQRGLTAIDMAEHLPKDLKSFKVQNILLKDIHHVHVGGGLLQRRQKQQQQQQQQQPAVVETAVTGMQVEKKSISSSAKAKAKAKASSSWSWNKLKRFMKYEGDNWLKDRNSGLMVAATVIATMAFQIAVNPPGGVWGEDKEGGNPDYCTESDKCLAGTAVLGYPIWGSDRYLSLVYYNAWAFLTSLSVILLLISGIPLEYKFCMWLLTVAMCLTLTFLTLTFREAVWLLTPAAILQDVDSLLRLFFRLWVYLLGIVASVRTLRFLFVIVTKLYKFVRKLFIANRSRFVNQDTLQVQVMTPPNV
ncbi:ankyrin repeat-containing protein ITN1-like isoform X1 [Ziziphus jujuba]|uniref:Ankyrin repeat-containing protein ITN1-like isoform X1 n=1 Tax=Ziziphus jujuba TaxID=326968 RepID=A0ABM4A2S7_ZIZJJ|nr:ankyrin repeat-containing protein ITN1-like isoform X1 [Ziziphus jujuba]